MHSPQAVCHCLFAALGSFMTRQSVGALHENLLFCFGHHGLLAALGRAANKEWEGNSSSHSSTLGVRKQLVSRCSCQEQHANNGKASKATLVARRCHFSAVPRSQECTSLTALGLWWDDMVPGCTIMGLFCIRLQAWVSPEFARRPEVLRDPACRSASAHCKSLDRGLKWNAISAACCCMHEIIDYGLMVYVRIMSLQSHLTLLWLLFLFGRACPPFHAAEVFDGGRQVLGKACSFRGEALVHHSPFCSPFVLMQVLCECVLMCLAGKGKMYRRAGWAPGQHLYQGT